MRVLCHAQHLTGVGHFVRMHRIACELAGAHEVHLVSGGRDVPRPPAAHEPKRLAIPRLARGDGGLVSLDAGLSLADALAGRVRALEEAASTIAPDVVLVDHYPFSKWELEDEILRTARAARRASSRAKIVASLRDVAPRTRGEDAALWEDRVIARLRSDFDALLVHADPAFTRFEEHFPRAGELALPIEHTGFVAGEAPAGSDPPEPLVVVSAGGGVRSVPFLEVALAAVVHAIERGDLAARRIAVFPGGALDRHDDAAIASLSSVASIEVHGFVPDLVPWLRRAALSVGRAGSNTTVELLRAGVPAVVVADERMSDQPFRAARLDALGLAVAAEASEFSIESAIVAALRNGRPAPAPFRFDGARATRRYLERLVA